MYTGGRCDKMLAVGVPLIHFNRVRRAPQPMTSCWTFPAGDGLMKQINTRILYLGVGLGAFLTVGPRL